MASVIVSMLLRAVVSHEARDGMLYICPTSVANVTSQFANVGRPLQPAQAKRHLRVGADGHAYIDCVADFLQAKHVWISRSQWDEFILGLTPHSDALAARPSQIVPLHSSTANHEPGNALAVLPDTACIVQATNKTPPDNDILRQKYAARKESLKQVQKKVQRRDASIKKMQAKLAKAEKELAEHRFKRGKSKRYM